MLATERMELRQITDADVDQLLLLHNDPEVMRFLTGGEPVSREEVMREVRERLSAPGYWAAIARVSGAFLGWFALHPTPERDPGEFELGYRLHREHWGQGYATEGARLLVQLGMREWGARRVWAQTMAVNLASRRVMENAGLDYVRTFHLAWDEPLPGTEHGEVEYALQRTEWEERTVASGWSGCGDRPLRRHRPDPDVIAADIVEHLQAALEEFALIYADLDKAGAAD